MTKTKDDKTGKKKRSKKKSKKQRPGGLIQYDTDKDGKVSKEELPERMRTFFDRIDKNGDGLIDRGEAAAAAAARKKRGNAAGSGAGHQAGRGQGGGP